MKLQQCTIILLEVFEALLHVLEPIEAKVGKGILVQLEDLQVLQSANQGHEVIVVGFELPLVQDLETEGVDVRAHIVNVLIEQLEILVLREVEEHLLEAQLEEKISPRESLRIIVNNSCLGQRSHDLTIVLVSDLTSQLITLVFDVLELTDVDFVVIIQLSVVSWG